MYITTEKKANFIADNAFHRHQSNNAFILPKRIARARPPKHHEHSDGAPVSSCFSGTQAMPLPGLRAALQQTRKPQYLCNTFATFVGFYLPIFSLAICITNKNDFNR